MNEIELAIGPGEVKGTYRVEVTQSPAGEAFAAVQLDVEALLARREQLQNAVLASASGNRSMLTATERPVREAGLALFSALLGSGEVSGRYRASAALAASSGQGLRVILRIATPALAGLPWEAMYDEAAGAYVCRRDHLVRTVPVASVAASLMVRPPLRVLGVISSPQGLTSLDVEQEQDHLARALSRLSSQGLIEVHWAPEATWASLHEILLSGEWHVVHFIGHGNFDAEQDEGTLALTGENGRAEWVEADRLVDLLRQARPMPRLVVLNTCYGAASGAQDLFAGIAAALVRGGVTAVAAMQYAISDAAAVAFARGFYAAIAHGRGVDDAISSGRVAILGTRARTLEWVTPVMYLRGHDPRLFVLPPRPPSATELWPELAGDGPVVPASHYEALRDRIAQQRRLQKRPPWVADEPTVERRVAEALFRTEAVRWRVTELERLVHDRPRPPSGYRHRIEEIFITEGPDAFVAALQRALATSVYPEGLQSSCRTAYRPDFRELVMEYELPRPDVVPKVAGYRYVPENDLMEEEPRPEGEIKKRYTQLIASMTLRALAEVFDAAPVAVVQDILFNGQVATEAPVTDLVRPCLISLRVSRAAFAGVRLDEVEPVACLRHYLRAIMSPHAYELEPVRPVAEFDLSGSRSVEMDLVAGLGRSPDLFAVEPVEFEFLIRRLFEAMGLTSWVTQTIRDGGVEGVAVNADAVFGGLCIIQAKQASKVLRVEAVRALAGVVEDTRAVKGILVTTSWVGKSGRDLAARLGRIEIIEGRQLKSLFREHLGLDVRVSLPRPGAAHI